MDNLTNEELQRAAERVRDMQRRASFVKNNSNENKPTAPPTKKPNERRKNILDIINFKNLEIDSDISLLMGILLMLSSETTDEILMLALIYIML